MSIDTKILTHVHDPRWRSLAHLYMNRRDPLNRTLKHIRLPTLPRRTKCNGRFLRTKQKRRQRATFRRPILKRYFCRWQGRPAARLWGVEGTRWGLDVNRDANASFTSEAVIVVSSRAAVFTPRRAILHPPPLAMERSSPSLLILLIITARVPSAFTITRFRRWFPRVQISPGGPSLGRSKRRSSALRPFIVPIPTGTAAPIVPTVFVVVPTRAGRAGWPSIVGRRRRRLR